MYLKQLTISGFKSFARKSNLIFNTGITAIVGPNGSGKSNIADAIRWVMGEQSIKSLRGKKSTDVIFSGSDKKTQLGLAEVSLELDNSDKQIPLEYSEVLISRRLYRNGDSEYLINNSKTKLSEINLLLSKANFGHHTYSIIGQGMIDNFLIASPQERKEFFDEATGVKQYQIKKQHSLNKLQATWQNLSTLNIKINEMEPQLRLLTRQMKKFKKRKETEKELQQKKFYYYSCYWQQINQFFLKQKKKLDELNFQKDKIYTDWKKLESKLEQFGQNSSFNQKINELRHKEKKLLDKKIKLKEKLLHINIDQAKTLNAATTQPAKGISLEQLKEINKKLKEISLFHSKLVNFSGTQENINFLKKQIIYSNKKINSLLALLKSYMQPTSKNQAENKNLSAKNNMVKDIEQQLSKTNWEVSSVQSKITHLQETDSKNRSSLWGLQRSLQHSQDQLNQINNKINEARVALARVETKRFDLKQEINYELGGTQNLNPLEKTSLSEEEKLNLTNKINKLKNQLEIIGGLDPEIETEYENAKQRYDFLKNQISDLTNTTQSLKKLIAQLEEIIKKQTDKSFREINKYFQKYFKILFSGGKAELILTQDKEIKKYSKNSQPENHKFDEKESNTINFFQEKGGADYNGVEIQATPPGKRLKAINALSGGERALTSIALICAIISSNPSPFVVLDEVDAALDEANSVRFAEILESLSTQSQFIVITHNRATMEKAKLLYGITMGNDGISRLLSIKLEEAKKFNQ